MEEMEKKVAIIGGGIRHRILLEPSIPLCLDRDMEVIEDYVRMDNITFEKLNQAYLGKYKKNPYWG